MKLARETNQRTRRLGKWAEGTQGGSSFARRFLIAIGGAVTGALVAFLADPQRGRARRARLVDQGSATVRRASRGAGRAMRAVATTAEGKIQAMSEGGSRVGPIDDVTIRSRAETELFRDPDVPKGNINLNVERGVLVLRGEVPDAAMRDRLEREAAKIEGVWSVKNLLHLPGEPAEELAASTS